MNDSEKKVFDSWISSQASHAKSITLSVVIPAYNEETRLPLTLMQLVSYLTDNSISHEIIVVDDGSKDKTFEVTQLLSKIRPEVKGIRLPKNYGKGHAVRTGALSANGEFVLFCDADGSTPWGELERLFNAIKTQKAEVAFGSRAMPSDDTKIKALSIRKYLGRMFNFLVQKTVGLPIHDTQCGFKLFTAKAAKFIFERATVDRWAFDVELLYIAAKSGIPIVEVPVNWNHVAGSKINLVFDSMVMLKDIIVIRHRQRRLEAGSFCPLSHAAKC